MLMAAVYSVALLQTQEKTIRPERRLEMKHREKAAREEMTSDKGKVGLALAKKGMAGDKITTQD